eukprot:CAMPEP_0113632924 /NCGR_PEP_ID=MMETSP0017_2-20120614/17121_1 /TAXON_ID=2856 /ORGANISM="Cylindrotheca closterium" /LENGTH=464 /DNA_ID=CAMNT_0000543515 /DNA_START=37 /DNA_END=1428 /DNA_ORIENTATION=- /assembly_acc=CAM_ASM_000147
MSSESEADSVQSQAESSMSSYVNVPSPNTGSWTTISADDEHTLAEVYQAQQYLQKMMHDIKKEQKFEYERKPPRNPVEPMIRELEDAMLGSSLDLRILPRADLIALSKGFLQRASSKKLHKPLLVVGYKVAERVQYDQIRKNGFRERQPNDDDDDSFCIWRALGCMPDDDIKPPTNGRLLRFGLVNKNKNNSSQGEPVVQNNNNTSPRQLWIVATIMENHHRNRRPDKITRRDIGSVDTVLPLACLGPRSFQNGRSVVESLAERLRGIVKDYLEIGLGLKVVRRETVFASPSTLSDCAEEEEEYAVGDSGPGNARYVANAMVSILSESSVNLKIVKEQEDLCSDLIGFFDEVRGTRFIGFKVAKQNQFEDIKLHGFKCGPGFHLCKTIENAISFWQSENSSSEESSSSLEQHLWIVLGKKPPPSNNPNAADISGTQVLPLACINVPSIANDPDALDKLLRDLEW